jgi:hypothetical protein
MNDHEFLDSPEDVAKQVPDADDALLDAIAPKEWTDKDGKTHELFPLSPLRIRALHSMGIKLATLTPDQWDAFEETKYYPGLSGDVILFLWIMLQPESAVWRADRTPFPAYQAAMMWGERQGIEPGNPQFETAGLIMFDALAKLNAAKGTPTPREKPKGGAGKAPAKKKPQSTPRR